MWELLIYDCVSLGPRIPSGRHKEFNLRLCETMKMMNEIDRTEKTCNYPPRRRVWDARVRPAGGPWAIASSCKAAAAAAWT